MPAIRLAAALAAAILAAGAAQADSTAVGSVERVQAQAEAVQAGRTRPLAVDSDVLFRDLCRTGEGARLEARLKDGTKLTLGERASLVVDAFVYDPGKSRAELAVHVAKGAFLYVGGLIDGAPGGKVEIRTPTAAIGVRGTTVWGGPIDKGFGVLALEGEVTVTTRRGAVTLRKGEGTMIFADGRPRPVVTWPAAKVDRAVAAIAFGRP